MADPEKAAGDSVANVQGVAPAAAVRLGESEGAKAQTETEIVEALADVPNVSQASVYRDSAILIAGATAFLYAANQIYGATYLSFFDVSLGFQGFGLANLAMIPFLVYLGILVFASFAYETFRTPRRWRLVLGSTVLMTVSAARLLSMLGFGGSVVLDDFPLIVATAAGLYVMLHFRSTWSKHLTKVEATAEKYRTLANRINDHKLDTPLARTLLRVERYAAARVWQLRSILFLACAYLTMVAALPATASMQAIESAQQERYYSVTGSTPPRVPVYWIGDRVVFLTFDGGCQVNVQIAGVLQSVRSCPHFVRAVIDLH